MHFDDVASPASPTECRANSASEKESDEPGLTLTIPQTAQLLGISRSRTYEAARIGQIPTIRVGTRILVSGN